jgi:hypothetical protein
MALGRHVLADVSGHGFGHLAQVAPVLNALRHRLPDLRLTVRCELAADLVRSRVAGPVQVVKATVDMGLAMHSALDVDARTSVRRYAEFHTGWTSRVAAAAANMATLRPDLVLADVPYLSLEAAARLSVPAVALCSLNWADIYERYAREAPEQARITAEIRSAYRRATHFLQPCPSMPMVDLPQRRPVGPIAALGRNRRSEVEARVGLVPGDRLVLVGLGGIETRLPVETWPMAPGTHWVVPAAWGVCRADVVVIEALGMPFLDVLASSDVLLTKTGYGSFVEAACNGVRVLHVPRPDWPEEPYLASWLGAHGVSRPVDRSVLDSGELQAPLEALLESPARQPPAPTGAEEAADVLAPLLAR